jgi:hypothetical protein
MTKEKRKLAVNVGPVFHPETGEAHMFTPDDDVPDWAVEAITTPFVWEDTYVEHEEARSQTPQQSLAALPKRNPDAKADASTGPEKTGKPVIPKDK